MSSGLKKMFTNNRIQEVLDGKGFEALNMLLLFLGSLVDLATGEHRDNHMRRAHTMIPEHKRC